jgi:penicillin G amidase
VVLAVGVMLFAAAFWLTRHVIPPLDGRTPVPGLRAAVDVRFDRFAIPHISASSDEDAWLAVGLLHGRDRLWQMELYRRAASGRLSEVLGEATVGIDRRFLTLGLRQAAEIEWRQTPPDVRTAFERYAAGVNQAMSAGATRLPLELQLLRVRPEPWTPVDSLAIGKLFAWRLGENHNAELLRYELAQALGPRAEELLPGPPSWAPTILGSSSGLRAEGKGARPSTVDRRLTHDDRRSTLDDRRLTVLPGLEWLTAGGSALSNSWVVSGARTASGRPLLANDPHLMIEMPSALWEAHITSPAMNVAGVTIPGVPFVIIGHNERIGWGLTNVGTDVQDFFIEQLDPARVKYLVGDTWIPIETTHYTIAVRGGQPLDVEVRSTRHGPILNAGEWHDPIAGSGLGAQPLEQTVLALKWDVIRGESAAAFYALSRAANWDEFVAATRKFSAPAQNFVYADVEGNIGYAMSGLLPLRSEGDGSVPLPGWPDAADWRAVVDPNRLPAALNPSAAQIVTANNEVARDLPFTITRDWVAPFRAIRIGDMLGTRQGLDIPSFAAMQADITSASADYLLRALGGAVPEQLRDWDRRVDARATSAFYEAFEAAMWRRTFADEMPEPLYGYFYRYAGNERFAGLRAIISDSHSIWFDDRSTPGVRETRDDVVRAAAADASASLRARFGDSSEWRWDQIHAVKFSHALAGGGRLLDWFFSRGPVPVAGDNMTVNKATTNLRRPFETSEAASYRQILDVGAWDESLGVTPSGQSGHPGSPHYFDQNDLWRQVRYHPMPFSRQAVERATAAVLELVP